LDPSTAWDGKYSLKVCTNLTKDWSWIKSNPVDVDPGERYMVITHMKYINVDEAHIIIEGYNSTSREWLKLELCPRNARGTSNRWREYMRFIEIPRDVTKVRFTLNAGHVLDTKSGEATTWFDLIEMYKVTDAVLLESIWLFNSDNEILLENIFDHNHEREAGIVISYKRINPTHWEVKVNATKPFLLSFIEAYDLFWVADVYKNGKLINSYYPLPLCSVFNGFYINETGKLKVVIHYKLQVYYNIGLWTSFTTFLLCTAYIVYDQVKRLSHRFFGRSNITLSLKA